MSRIDLPSGISVEMRRDIHTVFRASPFDPPGTLDRNAKFYLNGVQVPAAVVLLTLKAHGYEDPPAGHPALAEYSTRSET